MCGMHTYRVGEMGWRGRHIQKRMGKGSGGEREMVSVDPCFWDGVVLLSELTVVVCLPMIFFFYRLFLWLSSPLCGGCTGALRNHLHLRSICVPYALPALSTA